MINKWVGAGLGGNTLAYSNSNLATTWTSSPSSGIFSTSGNSLKWNGIIALAGGTGSANTLATSTDGITWTGIGKTTFTTSCNHVNWNTKRWIATGTGGNIIAYSYDGTVWYSALTGANLFTSAYVSGTNSKNKIVSVNSGLYMNTNDRLAITVPKYYDDSIASDTAISINMNLPYNPANYSPQAPTSLTFVSATTTSITFSFTQPSGSINSYRVTASPPSGTSIVQIFGAPTTTYTITGLSTGITYSVSMVAINLYGTSNSSSVVSMTTL
jgi:hypothetical protein